MHSWQSYHHVFGYNTSPNYDCPVSYAGCSRCKLLYLFVNMQCSVIQRFLCCENLHKGKNRINSIIEKLKVGSLALQQFQIKNTATGQHTINNKFFLKKNLHKLHVLSEDTDDTWVCSEAHTQKCLKLPIPENQYIKVVCMYSHKIVSFKTIKIYNCANHPGVFP
jgi:hypothetical protein